MILRKDEGGRNNIIINHQVWIQRQARQSIPVVAPHPASRKKGSLFTNIEASHWRPKRRVQQSQGPGFSKSACLHPLLWLSQLDFEATFVVATTIQYIFNDLHYTPISTTVMLPRPILPRRIPPHCCHRSLASTVERPPNPFTAHVTAMKQHCPDAMRAYAKCVLEAQEAGHSLHRVCEAEFQQVKECWRQVRGGKGV